MRNKEYIITVSRCVVLVDEKYKQLRSIMVVVEPPSLLERAELTRPIPENARKLAHLVEVNERRVEVG
ncbi:hypothetical protein NECAME_19068, partial [Necator americanus]